MKFYTSDHHFGHANILKYCPDRPWNSIYGMNEGLIDIWNKTISPEDDVIYLGDLTMNPYYIEKTISRLNFNSFKLIPGNHDKVWKGSERWVSQYKDWGIEVLDKQIETVIGDHKVLLCHLPYRNQENVDGVDYKSKYDEYRPVDKGLPLICGHIHQKWHIRNKMINVGVDVADPIGKPFSEDEIVEILNKL